MQYFTIAPQQGGVVAKRSCTIRQRQHKPDKDMLRAGKGLPAWSYSILRTTPTTTPNTLAFFT